MAQPTMKIHQRH